ncbi:CPXCG motif-containing cysteine-rich protein [Amphritea pacifica]|uniref:CPXCG motif-containing cysteine-rich protein n=1 Tax=Amphritea pacifica TaxID=2811233 RepID=A0ABS2W851_9GAMM|nr:CPXCG motif-containing cysteine-rich protein [Amphritea pacifica]MBN0987863.1 CPXCG motif-containing cysteine-rich protein [Amphritea pacifica]MBN1009082.1 CPXCG motif-containing cysteine-rich protein [Amphritea pacifica]
MQSLEAVSRTCPYCGEPVELVVDCTAGNQQYFEDCSVCCKPMMVELDVEGAEPVISLKDENEV